MTLIKKPALIVVDYQYDFASPQWSLSVKWGDAIGNSIKQLVDLFINKWREVIFTGDKHPEKHISFASTHWLEPWLHNGWYLWPDHCIDKTKWAELYPPLDTHKVNIKKAYTKDFDTYSGFGWTTLDETQTLDEYLQSKNITDLYVTWLATDFCVWDTALDSRNPEKVLIPYNTTFVSDWAKWVFEETTTKMIDTMKLAWVTINTTLEVLETLQSFYDY